MPSNQKKNSRSKRRKIKTPFKIIILSLCALLCFNVGKGILSLFAKTETIQPTDTPYESVQSVLDYQTYPDTGETIATILIDPGHGGSDGGMVGTDARNNYQKILEKDVTLLGAKYFKEAMAKINPQIKVELTRTSDNIHWDSGVFDEEKDLNGRLSQIKEKKADYFLSLHCNSFQDSTTRGYDMYIKPHDPAALALAGNITSNFEKLNWSNYRGTTTTDVYPLHVVSLADVTSMLLEIGFMTNQQELEGLLDENTLRGLMEGVAAAYSKYIMAHPEGPEPSKVQKNATEKKETETSESNNKSDSSDNSQLKKEEEEKEEEEKEETNSSKKEESSAKSS